MALLHGGLHPAIRAALDTSLTEDDVPVTVLYSHAYAPAAEAEVLRRVPLAESLAEPYKSAAERAAVFLCAALLAPAVPQLLQDRLGDSDSRYAEADWLAKAAELRSRADTEIQAALNTAASATYAMPTLFATAAGTRGL